MNDIAMWQLHLSDNPDTCDKCGEPLDPNCVEYGHGDTGFICSDCYSGLADYLEIQHGKER